MPEPSPRSSGPDALPQHTTPTWEVELLISGVAVFAMLQLPGWLDAHYFDLHARLGADWRPILQTAFLYLRATAMILAATFVLHLLLRAAWIALVGLDSVYPEGVDWPRLRVGPLTRSLLHARNGSFADAIERADNRATLVFASGVLLAQVTLKFVLLIVLAAAVVLAAGMIHPIPAAGVWAMLAFTAFLLPFVLAWAFDRRWGARLRPDGRIARTLTAILRGYLRIGFGFSGSPGALMISREPLETSKAMKM